MNASRLLHILRTNRHLVAVSGTTVIFMMGQGVVAPVLPLFAQGFGVGVALAGLAVGIFGLGRLVMGLPSGYLAQRFGRRLILVGGPVVTALGSLLMALSTNYGQLLAFRCIAGLGGGMQQVGANIFLVDVSTPATRARYLSLQILSILTGVSIGPVIGGFAAETWGLRAPFYGMAVLSGLSALWAWSQLPETRPTVEAPSQEARPAPATDVRDRAPPAGLKGLLLNPSFIVVGLFTLMIFLNRQGGRHSIMPLFAVEKGLTPGQIGVFLTVTVLPQFFAVIASGALSDRLGRKAVILPATAIMSLGLVIFIYGDIFWILLISAMVLGLGEGLSGSSPAAFAADMAPRGMEGVTMGLFRMFGDLGLILGPVMLGWVADVVNFSWSLGVDGLLLVAAALALMLVAKETAGRRRLVATVGE